MFDKSGLRVEIDCRRNSKATATTKTPINFASARVDNGAVRRAIRGVYDKNVVLRWYVYLAPLTRCCCSFFSLFFISAFRKLGY